MHKIWVIFGSRNRALFLIGFILLATAGGFMAGQLHKAASEEANLTPEEREAREKQEIAAEVDAIKSTPLTERDINYVDVGKLTVPVVTDGVTRAFLLAEITLEIYRSEAVRGLKRMQPRLRHHVTEYFYGQARRGTFANDDVDIGALSEGLRISLNTMIGEEAVSKVIFGRLLLQPQLSGNEPQTAQNSTGR